MLYRKSVGRSLHAKVIDEVNDIRLVPLLLVERDSTVLISVSLSMAKTDPRGVRGNLFTIAPIVMIFHVSDDVQAFQRK